MKGEATANGAATIINAIAGYRGVAYATTLKTKATVELKPNQKEIKGDAGRIDPTLIEKTVKKTLNYYNKDQGAYVKTQSNIPVARGLKSSSAAANATALATISALNIERNNQEILEITIEAAKEAEVTITGAMDDATASLLGGITITNNEKNKLIERREKNHKALIYIPQKKEYTKRTDVEKTRLLTKEIKKAYELAKNHHIYEAMTINGILYSTALDQDPEIILEALEAGAEAASLSGTGSAYTALVKQKNLQRVKQKWKKHGKVIETKINNEGAKIL
ncbi:shikimate kinase [archaeon SCG-AAA382B04]|nr:shikimate kinase [archaeon SCG-AAA382B04]